MIPTWLYPFANHLWQSTLFAAVAALLALTMNKIQARVRFCLWLAGSLKFLIPFSLLIAAGGYLGRTDPRVITPPAVAAVAQMTQPFTVPSGHTGTSIRLTDRLVNRPAFRRVIAVVWFLGFAAMLVLWMEGGRRVRAIVGGASPVESGRELEMLRRLERTMGIRKEIRLMTSPGRIEPGVMGIVHPIMLLPASVSERLTDAELEAVLAHELCHVKRHDNLTSAMHTIAGALFWFHPLVWWLGTRLMAEREQACDEEVLRRGSDPESYAEGILKICELYIQVPAACVSRVTGANLVKRIEAIMSRRIADRLNASKKMVLAAVGLLAVALPVAIGSALPSQTGVRPNSARALSFEVASVKVNKDGRQATGRMSAAGYIATNTPLADIIRVAFWVPSYLLSGIPDWARSERFDIDARVAAGSIPAGLSDRERNDYLRAMLQSLLAERFTFAIHRETKEMPVYVLTVAKNGPKLRKAANQDCIGTASCHNWGPGNPRMVGGFPGTSVDMDDLVDMLMNFRTSDRPVLNMTNIQGVFDIRLQWNPAPAGQEEARAPGAEREGIDNADPASLPSLFTALEEQLGLKLESRTGNVETIVIDHLERPTEN